MYPRDWWRKVLETTHNFFQLNVVYNNIILTEENIIQHNHYQREYIKKWIWMGNMLVLEIIFIWENKNISFSYMNSRNGKRSEKLEFYIWIWKTPLLSAWIRGKCLFQCNITLLGWWVELGAILTSKCRRL